jgi:hypothetical protein
MILPDDPLLRDFVALNHMHKNGDVSDEQFDKAQKLFEEMDEKRLQDNLSEKALAAGFAEVEEIIPDFKAFLKNIEEINSAADLFSGEDRTKGKNE